MTFWFKRSTLFLIIFCFSFGTFAQSKLDASHSFKEGIKALNNGKLNLADSLFTIVINYSPDASTYVNRAIVRKTLGDPIGYCKDLESASLKGDEEAEKALIKDCCLVDTLYRDSLFGDLKSEVGRYKVIRIRNRATQEVTEKLFDTNNELFYKLSILNGDTSIFGPGVQVAQYPGGEKAKFKMLNEKLKVLFNDINYEGIDGIVYTSFYVEKDGRISGAKVIKGISEVVDAEVLKVIKNMPNWTPTKCGDKLFRMRFNLPIRIFKVPDIKRN